jgi:L-alanine-DL-glutamate epimerase-like enolase superfamily enzyme
VIQSDPDWCGGVSELVKICTLASAFGKHVVPHGHSVHAAVHVIAAQSPAVCPMAEFLLRANESKQHFRKHRVWPERGSVALPQEPGLGLAIDESKVEKRTEL